MNAELYAIGALIAWSIFTFFFSLVFIRRSLSKYDIDQLKDEFTEIVNERLQTAIDSIGEAFGEILTEPTVKKAFSIIGAKGNEAQASTALIDEMANDVLNGPQFSAIQLAAEAMGLDIGGYIEKHGAAKTINAARQFAQLAGIDLMNFDLGNLSLPGPATRGGNIYLQR